MGEKVLKGAHPFVARRLGYCLQNGAYRGSVGRFILSIEMA